MNNRRNGRQMAQQKANVNRAGKICMVECLSESSQWPFLHTREILKLLKSLQRIIHYLQETYLASGKQIQRPNTWTIQSMNKKNIGRRTHSGIPSKNILDRNDSNSPCSGRWQNKNVTTETQPNSTDQTT